MIHCPKSLLVSHCSGKKTVSVRCGLLLLALLFCVNRGFGLEEVSVKPGEDLYSILSRASTGTTVRLGEGVWTFSRPLIIDAGLTIIGQRASWSRIISTATEAAILLTGRDPVSISSVSCEFKGDYGDFLRVENPNTRIEDCSISGGKVKGDFLDGNFDYGAGIRTQKAGGGIFRRIHCTKNDFFGILLGGKSPARVLENRIVHNGGGICIDDFSSGVIVKNSVLDNSGFGICIGGSTVATVLENQVAGNACMGMAFNGRGTVLAKKNVCLRSQYGIILRKDANPELIENDCRENSHSGICYGETSGGRAENNTCSENSYGILVQEDAHPKLMNNRLFNNRTMNLYFPSPLEKLRLRVQYEFESLIDKLKR
jgi:parallel beta-helix repeat protein